MQEAILISLSGLRQKIAAVFPDLSKGWPQEVHLKDYNCLQQEVQQLDELTKCALTSVKSKAFELKECKSCLHFKFLSMYILWIILYRLFIEILLCISELSNWIC